MNVAVLYSLSTRLGSSASIDVANAQPQRLFVWRRFILAALRAAEADDRRQILAHALAIQTLFQVRIESELIALANRCRQPNRG